MKLLKGMPFVVSAVLLIPLNSYADDEFYGIIESRPDGKPGTWVIGGRQVEVTERTKLEGPLAVGTCAEVEYEGNLVEEIESEKMSKCGK
jgi:hypothetical protein